MSVFTKEDIATILSHVYWKINLSVSLRISLKHNVYVGSIKEHEMYEHGVLQQFTSDRCIRVRISILCMRNV